MRSAFAAAVAAVISTVVFSSAFQPAQASMITIDQFTVPQTATTSGGPDVAIPNLNDGLSGTFGPFQQRLAESQYEQNVTRGTRTLSASSSSGLGTLNVTNNGSGTGTSDAETAFNSFAYYTQDGPVDLTGQQYAGFWIETAATSSTPSNAFQGYIQVVDDDGNFFKYFHPTMWAPNAATGVPFSAFPGIDFTKVSQVNVGIMNTVAELPGSTAYTATANFTAISIPEPSQMVFVAGIGATLGAWLLRKLRRARGGSEAAAV